MSTQSSFPSIPFTESQPFGNFRLVELPAELVELLRSDAPPTLYFKSSTIAQGSSNTAATPRTKAAEFLHLCSPTQSYQVRQVSTSNSVYITQPAANTASVENNDTEMLDVASSASSSITAIGQIGSVLELQPVSHDVELQLQRILPAWTWDVTEDPRKLAGTEIPSLSRCELFDEIPAPNSKIELALHRLFVVEVDGQVYIPSKKILLEAWRDIIETFSLRGNSVKGSPELGDFQANSGDAEVLANVKQAIWASTVLGRDSKLENETGLTEDISNTQLDSEATTRWVGELVLQNKAGVSTLKDFISAWQNLLPETWRPMAKVDILTKGTYEIESLGDDISISWTGGMHGFTSQTNGSGSSSKEPAKTGDAKRKWHEKFKDSRNVKR